MRLEQFPRFDPNSIESFQVDLRGRNLSALDLTGRKADLEQADFDTRTIWPPADKLPPAFDPRRILELGKIPGLGVRSLHARGVTGRGVGIAMVDQPLLVDHHEYAERLRLYEEIGVPVLFEWTAPMHGAAVASAAVGKTVGVAPEADLYYIGSSLGIRFVPTHFRYYALAVRRVLKINDQLPSDRKIRVIAIQVGWDRSQIGFAEMNAACAEARSAGLLVVSSSIEQVHGFRFHGLGRDPLADPDQFASYGPGSWWAKHLDRITRGPSRLLVPMDARTLASHTGVNNYLFCRQGGWSWSIPFIAGTYALAAQVEPSITPERFWSLAMKTGRTVEVKQGSSRYSLGPILDPVALIDALKAGKS
jgi:hypothetical protein